MNKKSIWLFCYLFLFQSLDSVLANQADSVVVISFVKDSVTFKDFFVLIGDFEMEQKSFDLLVLDRKMRPQKDTTLALNAAVHNLGAKLTYRDYEIRSLENRLFMFQRFKRIGSGEAQKIQSFFEFDLSLSKVTNTIPFLSGMDIQYRKEEVYFEVTPKGILVSAYSKFWAYLFATKKWSPESGKRLSNSLVKITPEYFLSYGTTVIPKCQFSLLDSEGNILTDFSKNFCDFVADGDRVGFIKTAVTFENLNKGILMSQDGPGALKSWINFDIKPLKFYRNPRPGLEFWINYLNLLPNIKNSLGKAEAAEGPEILGSFNAPGGAYLKILSHPALVHKEPYFQRSPYPQCSQKVCIDGYVDAEKRGDYVLPDQEETAKFGSISYIFLPQPRLEKVEKKTGPEKIAQPILFGDYYGLRNLLTGIEGVALPYEDNSLVFFSISKNNFNPEGLRPYFKMMPNLRTVDSTFVIDNLFTKMGANQNLLKASGLKMKIAFQKKELRTAQPIHVKYGEEFIIDYEGPKLLAFNSSLIENHDYQFDKEDFKKGRLNAGIFFIDESKKNVSLTFKINVRGEEQEVVYELPVVASNVPTDVSLCKIRRQSQNHENQSFFYTIRLNEVRKMTLREEPKQNSKVLLDVVPIDCFYMSEKSIYDYDPGFDALEKRGDWFKVNLRSDKTGWIKILPIEVKQLIDRRLIKEFDDLGKSDSGDDDPGFLCRKPELPCIPINCKNMSNREHDRYKVVERVEKGDEYWWKVKVSPCKPTSKSSSCVGWALPFGPKHIHVFSNIQEGALCDE
jgi:hypothetical protein